MFDSFTESESRELEKLVFAVHEFLCKHGRINGSDWAFNGWLPDGRAVRHKIKLGGYERTGPTVDAERKKLGLPTPPTVDEEISRLESE
jgi:hypothetical protein